ncbi:phosphotransferase [Dermatobacter hominis]|uniref:phosphotransferase n=1 Tax=Dermatobacter hominis TaxID=2884263 RepID=UPI001D11E349|nr:phosphotransferase [Dermatobacter hominis]UDY38057.1 phosphotransferase [Dermatobacter hominis]
MISADTATALLEALRSSVGDPALCYRSAPAPLAGGFYAEMLRFRLDGAPPELDRELVARIVPNPELGRFEAAVQGGVADQGFPTPVVRLTCDEHSPLGRFLVVMDLVDGHPPLAGLGAAKVLTGLPTLVRHLPDQLAGIAARLHALDPDPVEERITTARTDVPSTTTGFVEHQVTVARSLDAGALVAAGEDLLATMPTGALRVVTHGDLHPFNLLEGPHGTILIDWTLGAIAHPAFTLSFTQLLLDHPPVGLPRAAAGALRPITRRMSARFLDSYRRRAPDAAAHLDADQMAWHRKVHALRILVEIEGWDAGAGRPPGHPWTSLEPVARSILALPPLSG